MGNIISFAADPTSEKDLKRQVLIICPEQYKGYWGDLLDQHYNIIFLDVKDVTIRLGEFLNEIHSIILDCGDNQIIFDQVIDISNSIPVIIVTDNPQFEAYCINAGAYDSFSKSSCNSAVILARINKATDVIAQVSSMRIAERDRLTGLFTDSFFYEYASLRKKYYTQVVMDAIVINIDHFHLVNSMYGRRFGDSVLTNLAGSLYDYCKDGLSIVSRGEADSFLLYVQQRSSYEPLLEIIYRGFSTLTIPLNLRVRIGIYQNLNNETNLVDAFDKARTVCNNARGRSPQICYYNETTQRKEFYEIHLLQDFKKGLESNQFQVHYQPKYDITGEPIMCGVEALVRWYHPEFGIISPTSFIQLFEENGLIQQLDYYVWRVAAAQLRYWRDQYGFSLPISVNMSRIDIYDGEIINRLNSIIEDYHLERKDLHLELTESAYMENAEQLINVVEKLRNQGFLIEMDDFGAGYSSLNMVTSMPIDVLKMDMRFVKNLEHDQKSQRLVKLVMDIAEMLGVPVIAEGVEEKGQYDFLKSVGCNQIQGFYFSKPLTPQEFELLMKR